VGKENRDEGNAFGTGLSIILTSYYGRGPALGGKKKKERIIGQ